MLYNINKKIEYKYKIIENKYKNIEYIHIFLILQRSTRHKNMLKITYTLTVNKREE